MGKINDLKDQALASLRGKWGSFAGLTFIYILLTVLVQLLSQFGTIFKGSSFTTLTTVFMAIGAILSILIIPLQYGYSIAHLNASRQDLPADIGDLFCGYKHFGRVTGTLILMALVIVAVALPCIILAVIIAVGLENVSVGSAWFICLVALMMIPIWVLVLAYSLVPFLIHDDEDLHAGEILKKSRMMMRGHKWELFILYLSFIGWWILCILTLLIGYLWLAPYTQMTLVKFYENLRVEYEGVGNEEMPLYEEASPVEEAAPVEETETPADVTE